VGLKEEVIDMKKEVQEVKERSLTLEILSDYKKANKRLFIITLILLFILLITFGYLTYVLNDIEYEETTTETETYDIEQDSGDDGNNNFINGKENEVNNV